MVDLLYRHRRTAHEAIDRVAQAIVYHKTRIIDVDLCAYIDNVRHHILLEKVAKRVNDDEIMRLLKLILNASGKKGVPEGGVIPPCSVLTWYWLKLIFTFILSGTAALKEYICWCPKCVKFIFLLTKLISLCQTKANHFLIVEP